MHMKATFTLLLLLFAGSSFAQLQLLPQGTAPKGTNQVIRGKSQAISAARALAAPGDTLSLPFWDDFSYKGQLPDSLLWPFNTTTNISYGLAANPVSWGVVTFDGIDANGNPYATSNSIGRTDSLQSAPINLGLNNISEAERASVILSFYWQLQGRGERPDKFDSIRLYFFDESKQWHQVWSEGGNPQTDPTKFQQKLISLQEAGNRFNTNFFHPGFKFKFQSFSRQNGRFDQWHLDWIYLNSGRSINDPYYQDRAISDAFTSLFGPYTAIPIEQFFTNPAEYLQPELTFVVHSLVAPGIEEVLTYDLVVNTEKDEIVKVLAADKLLISDQGSLLKGQGFFTEDATGLSAEDLAPFAVRDSVTLITTLSLRSEEPQPFFHRNDVFQIVNPLGDYFAYDDGSAEAGVSLNGRGQRLAYQFALAASDTLTGISFYFPSYGTSANGSSLDIKIWSQLAGINNGTQDVLIYTQQAAVNRKGVNGFVTYTLVNPQVLPAGIFYIGYEQTTQGAVPLGLDRNTDSSPFIYYSVNNIDWINDPTIQGSLMIRPHFERGVDPDILGIEEVHFPPVRLYPNPTRDRLWVESEAKVLRLYDPQGRLLLTQPTTPTRTELQLRHLKPGLYLLQLEYREGVQTRRVLVVN